MMKILASLKDLEPEQFYVVSELMVLATGVASLASFMRGAGGSLINSTTVMLTIMYIVFIVGLYYIIDAVKVNYPVIAWLIALIPIFFVLYMGAKTGDAVASFIMNKAMAQQQL